MTKNKTMKCNNCGHELQTWEENSNTLKGVKYKMKCCMNCGAVYMPEPVNAKFAGLSENANKRIKIEISNFYTI